MERSAEALTPGGWRFHVPDWEARLREGRSLVPDLPLDMAEADRAVGIFDKLRLPDVAGQPAMAEAAGDWFRDILRAAFGALDPETGVRHISEIFALVPKKNSKTTGGAGVMVTALLMNERPQAEMWFVGPTQEIADLAFMQAAGMIQADPEGYLQKRFDVKDHIKTIVDRRTKARLKIKTFDVRVATGGKPVIVLVDELHIMALYSYARRVMGQLRGGMLANPESLLIFITTQSDQVPAGVFKQELSYARGVRDGRIAKNVHTLPILYEFPEEMQTSPERPWADPKNWPMVLPNLGRSIAMDRLVADWEMAREMGEEEVRRWASQHLNVEIGMALHSDRWRGADYWQQAVDVELTLERLIERSDVVTVGVDGGGLDDLLGLAVLGRCRETRDWLLWSRAWVQQDVLALRKEIAERLRDFEAAGELVICGDEPTRDIEELADIVERIFGAGLLPEKYGVGLDPVGVSAIIDALAERGIETEAQGGPVCAVYQGYKLSGAVWGMERKLKDGTLYHPGQALMAWAVDNAKVELRGNAVLVTKQAAGKAKIDPLIAAFNAFMLMSRGPMAAGEGDAVTIPADYVVSA